jgi:hypothetical protein
MTRAEADPGSFRDRDGRVFYRGGRVYRALRYRALTDWEALSRSRFFAHATDQGRIIADIPLENLVGWLARLGAHLVMELVTRDDPMVQRLSSSKEDIYHDYNLEGFEGALGRHFLTLARRRFHGGTRVLYSLRPRSAA